MDRKNICLSDLYNTIKEVPGVDVVTTQLEKLEKWIAGEHLTRSEMYVVLALIKNAVDDGTLDSAMKVYKARKAI